MEYRQIGSKAPLLFVPAPPLSSRRLWPYVLRDPTQLPLLPLLAGGCGLPSRKCPTGFGMMQCQRIFPPNSILGNSARYTLVSLGGRVIYGAPVHDAPGSGV